MDLDGLALAIGGVGGVVLLAVLGSVRRPDQGPRPAVVPRPRAGAGLALPGPGVQDAQLATVLGYGALVVIWPRAVSPTQVKDLRPVLWLAFDGGHGQGSL